MPTAILKEQDSKAVQLEIVKLLERLVVLYQIPNWTAQNGIMLSEWVLDKYKYDKFESVKKCLLNPPPTDDKTFRLTPDVISEWMAITLEREAEAHEKELSKEKGNVTFDVPADTDLSKETKQMIQDYINSLSGVKMVQAMTDADVKKYGKERYKEEAKSVGYVPPNKEYLIEKELRRRWINECYDAVTGKPLENWLSFEEYKLL